MQLEVGQTYGGKYRIVRQLGAGSMGAVYEGENTFIHRRVAIKTLHPSLAEKKEVVERFEREAQAAGRIGSQHIVEVLDLGELEGGARYLVMEFLEGATLDGRIRASGRLQPHAAAMVVEQLLDGLEAAHAAGIIHRDLKPANVFLCAPKAAGAPEFVKILDFGVSKFSALDEEMSMTRTGMVLGTPYYMSPEQAKGTKELDGRSDLYAVGVILYEAITGQLPFAAETFNELLFRIVLESPPPAETYVPDLDPEFAAIIRRAMAREPGERFQTAADFRSTLATWREQHDPAKATVAPPQARPRDDDQAATRMYIPPTALPALRMGEPVGSQPAWAAPPPPRSLWAYAGAGLGLGVLVGGLMFLFVGTPSSDARPATGATSGSTAGPAAVIAAGSHAVDKAPADAPQKPAVSDAPVASLDPTSDPVAAPTDTPPPPKSKGKASGKTPPAPKAPSTKPPPPPAAAAPPPPATTAPPPRTPRPGRTVGSEL
jgi:serine/threonine protein kinase